MNHTTPPPRHAAPSSRGPTIELVGGPADGLTIPIPRTMRFYAAEVVTDERRVAYYTAWDADDWITDTGRLVHVPGLPESAARARGRVGDAILTIDLTDPRYSGEGVLR